MRLEVRLPEPKRTFRSLAATPDAESLIPAVVPWVHEAGRTYFDWFFGGAGAARAAVEEWMRRDGSELSIRRVTVLLEAGEPVGGFLALRGFELARCRKADAITSIRDAGLDGRATLRERWRQSAGLRGAVGPDEFYLSKIGVLEAWRGRGLGRALVIEYLRSGRQRGLRDFRLDVDASSQPVIALYTSLGFRVVSHSASSVAGLRLLSMTYADPK